jgi:GNAT superfamily N-acetyltransferase
MISDRRAESMLKPDTPLSITGAIDWSVRHRVQYIHCGGSTLALELEDRRRAQIVSLRTLREKSKRKGTARAVLQHVCAESDRRGVTLSLLASPLTKKTSRPRLVRFYASLGFEPNGRTGNLAGDPIMIRTPRSPIYNIQYVLHLCQGAQCSNINLSNSTA